MRGGALAGMMETEPVLLMEIEESCCCVLLEAGVEGLVLLFARFLVGGAR